MLVILCPACKCELVRKKVYYFCPRCGREYIVTITIIRRVNGN